METSTTVKSREMKRSVGVVTVEFTRETKPCTVISVLDPETHEQCDITEAIERGLFTQADKTYHNTLSGMSNVCRTMRI